MRIATENYWKYIPTNYWFRISFTFAVTLFAFWLSDFSSGITLLGFSFCSNKLKRFHVDNEWRFLKISFINFEFSLWLLVPIINIWISRASVGLSVLGFSLQLRKY